MEDLKMKVKFQLSASPEDSEPKLPKDIDYESDKTVGAFLFAIDKGGDTGCASGGFNGDMEDALLLIDKMLDIIDGIVGSDKNLTLAYLKLLEERAKDQAEDKIQKIQLDIEGIREQLRKDREEGSDAE